MASYGFIKLCYGVVSEYKDTSKMTVDEVVEEFIKHEGVSSADEYYEKCNKNTYGKLKQEMLAKQAQSEGIDKNTSTNISDARYPNTEFTQTFTQETLDSFGIQRLGDYIHVQRQVFNTLLDEGFFTNVETRSRTDINEKSGMVIETNKSGIDETFTFNNFVRLGKFKKIAKLATIRDLPNAIKYGHIVEDNVTNKYDNSDKNKTFAYIEYATKVAGNEIVTKLAIKKSPQKNKFWVHSIYTIENVNDSPASTD